MSDAGLRTGATAEVSFGANSRCDGAAGDARRFRGASRTHAPILVIFVNFMHDRRSWRPLKDAQT
jgi:hypothetical protein